MPTWEPETAVVERCTDEVVGAALADISGVSLVSVSINRTGQLDVPASIFGFPSFVETDLPAYCQAVVRQASPAGNIAEVLVWVPLVWNGRFLGTAGGGTRTTGGHLPRGLGRSATLANSVRNGFASAATDGGVGADPRVNDWPLDENTGELDWDLIENWVHRSTHEMTIIGKAVTAAIHGREPDYSYFQGFSGGGRQALVQAQRYPADYDGVWAGDPAINWTRFIPAEMWPALMMKELGTLAPEKFDAFRSVAIAEANRSGGASESFAVTYGESTFDANRAVGQSTAARRSARSAPP